MADASPDVSVTDGASEASDASEDAKAGDASKFDASYADADVLPMDAVEIVGPSVCAQVNGQLRHCQFGPTAISAPSSSSVPPVRTIIRMGHTGDCQTQYLFEIGVSAMGVDDGQYILFHETQEVLQRLDGTPIAGITLTDISPFAGQPVYSLSCRVWLTMLWNVGE